jgi:riboflavin synthase
VFTGIVQSVGKVARLEPGRLCLKVPDAWPGDPWKLGESLAVDGCCLTVASAELEFDLSPETLSRTTLGSLGPGARVNLERALRACDRLGGHFVQGHVDTVGVFEGRHGDEFRFSVKEEFSKYLADKGSVAVNGVSLTVVQPSGGGFHAAVVPHTLRATNLGDLQEGKGVNVEFDVLAKYVLNPR